MQQRPTMAQRRQRAAANGTGNASSATTAKRPPDDDDIDVPPPPRQHTTTGQRTTSSNTGSQSQAQNTQQPLHNGTATQLGGGTVEWKAFGQTVYVRDATKHPPMASFIIAFIIGIFAVGAIVMQMITTFSAYSNMVFDGKVWEHFT